jgi:hypothetical protein
MDCKEARRLVLRPLLGPSDERPDLDLARHLSVCRECSAYDEGCRRVRDEVRGLEPLDGPAELGELIAQGVRQAFAERPGLKHPPASPAPEIPSHKKALIVVGAIVLLMAATAGLLAAFRGEYKPVPPVAQVGLFAGKVDVRLPGTSEWRAMGLREFLPPGVQFRTDRDSLLELRSEGAEWRLPAMSALALNGPAAGELLFGRVCVRCEGTTPVRLASEQGTVDCVKGEFTAAMSLSRLRVGCVSGKVTLTGDEGPAALEAGQCAVEAERRLSGPVRSVRPGQLAHWLMEFDRYGEQRLCPRQLASVRVTSGVPALPDALKVEYLDVAAAVRGPVALVNTTLSVRNTGAEPWQGTVRSADVLLPPVLAQAGSGELSIAPGRSGTFETSALCLMQSRMGFYALGLNAAEWTRQEIPRLRVTVDATAEGGLRSFRCPTMDYSARRPGVVRWSAQREHVSPLSPVVLEFEFSRADGADALALETPERVQLLAGWRAEAVEDEWIRKGRNVFPAFDASADFGAGGPAYAQEVMESLLGFLPPGASTALIAYDGTLKVDRDPLMRHVPARVEAMLDALWRLDDGGRGQTAEFLAAAVNLASGAKGEGLLMFVTGRDTPGDLTDVAKAARESGLRVAVLQAGADEPAPAYRALCAATGGVAMALPDSVAPDLAVADFASNLRSAGLARVSVSVRNGAARLLCAEGGFSGQPVAALLELPPGAEAAEGEFRAQAGESALKGDFAFHIKADTVLSGPLVRGLVQDLRARLAAKGG